jgi:nucleoside-diphosphate-sugar epimerase
VQLNFGARDYARFEPMYLAADISRARTLLNWRPKINFAHAIWELAQESFPSLKLKQPGAAL